MRCGLALALIYRPRVLFLDEPTVGLDVTAVAMIRRFIAAYSRQTRATVLLTNHSMADVATLCKRIVLIDKGTLRYDGELVGLAARLAPYKLVKVALAGVELVDWRRYGEPLSTDDGTVTLRVERPNVPTATGMLLAELLAVPAVLLATALRFLFTYLLALAAFWTEQAHGVVGFGEMLLFLLGGSAAPLTLFPGSLRPLGEALPFGAMLGFPAAVAAGSLSGAAVVDAYGRQLLWIAVLLPAAVLLWRAGLRRYTAVGG
jgi:hypothetical protein